MLARNLNCFMLLRWNWKTKSFSDTLSKSFYKPWRWPETILEIRKNARCFQVINKHIIYKLIDFISKRKKTYKAVAVVFGHIPLLTFLNPWGTVKSFQELAKENSCIHIFQRSPNCNSPCFSRLYSI